MFLADHEMLLHDKPFNSTAFSSKTGRWVMKLFNSGLVPEAVTNNTIVPVIDETLLPPVVINEALRRALSLYKYEHVSNHSAEDFEKLHVYGNLVSQLHPEKTEQEKAVILYQTLVQHEQFPKFIYGLDELDEWMYSISWVWNTYRNYDQQLKKWLLS